ncbi:MAG: hypothetical protein ACFE89_05880 [Candidatus Hodarchaeota archaeon]
MPSVYSTDTTPGVTTSQFTQRFWLALLIALVIVCVLWGFFQPYPFNILLWVIALAFLIIFLFMIYRGSRGPPQIKLAEVRRLISCESCGVETEGPFETGDHVFRKVGSCPRCGGLLYVKAIYSIEGKEPLKRQQPPEQTTTEAREAPSQS